MSSYGAVLFIHVVSAILLVSGGIYTHLAISLAPVRRAWMACGRICCGCTSS